MGKSATANTISGGDYFKSEFGAQAVTQICQQQKVTRFGRGISIIDTPGIFDRKGNESAVEKEIKRCVSLGAPGLHAILYVIEIGRIRKEDIKTIRNFLKFFGKEMENRVIVVFTHGDKLLNAKQTLSDYLETVPVTLKTFLHRCEDRVILFNNQFKIDEEQNYEQILNILLTIEIMKIKNRFAFYYDDMFKKAEERVQQREEEIRKMVEMEYKEKIEELESQMDMTRVEPDALKKPFEETLSNVREKVREEIKSKESTW